MQAKNDNASEIEIEYPEDHKLTEDVAETRYYCKLCPYVARRKRDLSKHVAIHQRSLTTRTYDCSFCSYKTRHKGNFSKHVLTHQDISEITTHNCSFCSYKAKQKGSLTTHMLIHKDDSEITTYDCNFCSYKAKRKDSLTKHMLIHKDVSEVTTYDCCFCSYKAKRNGQLVRHMLIHKDASEITTYQCALCPYKAKQKSHLTGHMLIHTDTSEITTYDCSFCSYKAKFKSNLTTHMLIHKDASEITTYQCTLCPYKTKWKKDLPKHMQNHKNASEVTTYDCRFCSYKAKQKGNLTTHMLIHEEISEGLYCFIIDHEGSSMTSWSELRLGGGVMRLLVYSSPESLCTTDLGGEDTLYRNRITLMYEDTSGSTMQLRNVSGMNIPQGEATRREDSTGSPVRPSVRSVRPSTLNNGGAGVRTLDISLPCVLLPPPPRTGAGAGDRQRLQPATSALTIHSMPMQLQIYDGCPDDYRIARSGYIIYAPGGGAQRRPAHFLTGATAISRLHRKIPFRASDIVPFAQKCFPNFVQNPAANFYLLCQMHIENSTVSYEFFTSLYPARVRTFDCSFCSYKAKYKRYLTTHMLTHKDASEVVIYQCALCSYKTKRKGNLRSHILIHKNASEVTTYDCSFCSYKAKHKYHLTRHVVTHQDTSEDVKSAQNQEQNVIEYHESEGCLAIKSEELAIKEEEDECGGAASSAIVTSKTRALNIKLPNADGVEKREELDITVKRRKVDLAGLTNFLMLLLCLFTVLLLSLFLSPLCLFTVPLSSSFVLLLSHFLSPFCFFTIPPVVLVAKILISHSHPLSPLPRLVTKKIRTKKTEVVRVTVIYLSASRRRCKQCCARHHVIYESHMMSSGSHVKYFKDGLV
ncbi:hypothetical protein NQ318_005956 [Aromia moschata]|uniref:C2H2-type domain-containing protein n=1 Tax=Aromia moschata TaxID=1265417 RepID=A0AAV8XF63_9CUCU|nr:hypothetical protein NQ318_005956 [Aromia moschata]